MTPHKDESLVPASDSSAAQQPLTAMALALRGAEVGAALDKPKSSKPAHRPLKASLSADAGVEAAVSEDLAQIDEDVAVHRPRLSFHSLQGGLSKPVTLVGKNGSSETPVVASLSGRIALFSAATSASATDTAAGVSKVRHLAKVKPQIPSAVPVLSPSGRRFPGKLLPTARSLDTPAETAAEHMVDFTVPSSRQKEGNSSPPRGSSPESVDPTALSEAERAAPGTELPAMEAAHGVQLRANPTLRSSSSALVSDNQIQSASTATSGSGEGALSPGNTDNLASLKASEEQLEAAANNGALEADVSRPTKPSSMAVAAVESSKTQIGPHVAPAATMTLRSAATTSPLPSNMSPSRVAASATATTSTTSKSSGFSSHVPRGAGARPSLTMVGKLASRRGVPTEGMFISAPDDENESAAHTVGRFGNTARIMVLPSPRAPSPPPGVLP